VESITGAGGSVRCGVAQPAIAAMASATGTVKTTLNMTQFP
jgi:hypothetical protein